jgi:uncharacterized YigZ family protein
MSKLKLKTGVIVMEEIYTFSQITTRELVIDKSRFIAIAVPITSQVDIKKAMQEIRRDYPNARHYVYAYRLHDGFIEKASDDGEPQGTGGHPILDLLQHRNIWNVLIVVVRYFGGVLLGTGRLSRAYGGVTRQVINDTELKKLTRYCVLHLRVPYEWFGPLKYQFGEHNWFIKEEEYSEVVQLIIMVPKKEIDFFGKWIDDFTRKQVDYNIVNITWN